MSRISPIWRRGACLRAAAGALLVLTACADNPAEPRAASAEPLDPGAPALAVLDKRSDAPGIVHGTFLMRNSHLSQVHTGWMNGGALDPSNILTWLSGARARDARVVIKLCKGKDSYVKNADGTFSLSKWKDLVRRYRNVNFGPYIADGTILGHFLIDEPHRAKKWGGKPIPPATLEEMARFSKQLWPGMTTMVRVVPSWLASSRVTFTYLDAGWAQFEVGKGDPTKWINAEAEAAKRRGLGLVGGMNVLDGGNGSSKIAGWTKGKYAMSATEIRTVGSAILAQGYVCGFYNWSYDSDYYGRDAIKKAMAEVSAKARKHAKTSCRQ